MVAARTETSTYQAIAYYICLVENECSLEETSIFVGDSHHIIQLNQIFAW